MSLVSQLQTAFTRVGTEFKTVRAEMAALSGGSAVKAHTLPDMSDLALLDTLIARNVDNPSQDATNGSLSELPISVLLAYSNRLTRNASVGRVINGAGAADTYLTGSNVVFPAAPAQRTIYRATFDVAKTAAGTATPIITVRTGSNASTADTSRGAFTFAAGTAAADTAVVEVMLAFRAVGATAVLSGWARATTNLTTTGWSNAVKSRTLVSSSFDSTGLAGLNIGLSYNGGSGAVHTVEQVEAELVAW